MNADKTTPDPETNAVTRCFSILLRAAARRRRRLGKQANEEHRPETVDGSPDSEEPHTRVD